MPNYDDFQYGVTVRCDDVGSMDADQYGDAQWTFYKRVQEWIDDYGVELNYWFPPDPSLIVIDFERRGQAAIFMTLFNKDRR